MTSTLSRTRALAAGVAVASLVAGCAAVGPDFKTPAAPAAKGYAMAGDDANAGPIETRVGDKVVADWWTLFHSPQLDQLVRQAIANNRSLEAARARLAASREAVGAESGNLMVDANAGIQRERANLNAFSGGAFNAKALPGGLSFPTNPEFNLYTLGTTVSYDLDVWGAKRRRVEAAKADAEAQARELDAAYLTLTGKVVAQALTAADASIQVQALADIVRTDQQDLDMIRRARDAGGAAAADVAAAETALAEDQAMVPVQQQRLAAARHALAALVGKSPDGFDAPVFDASSGSMPASLPVSLPSELVRQRPDILEAEARLHAATAQVGVETAALYPNITLSANYALNGLTPDKIFDHTSTSWAIAGGLTAPIFHSGELKAKQREAQENARAALATYEQTVLDAFGQVADALTAIAHDNASYAEQTRALDAATRRLDMVRKAFAEGGTSAEQVVRAERDWRRTKLALSEQGTGRVGDAARLLLATANVPPGAVDASGAAQHSGQ
ncbi:efflux transporter outer membrane subunit [Phenylobacterium montanum]|uniref:Efflux transporter outer membrane subunit n=1 Tax=Phenylobacterium montanum TaxID=2823693 RepID=A0A975IT89_9CAUL|nr:efflux transporter outer membrane subunit [Caulobacter sp. S6]QUD86612.1 efflux transporter outer membrane subunit [Caulobacter sp. S6]